MITVRTTNTGRRYDVRLRDPDGRVYTRTFPTKREAEAYAAREHADRSRGSWIDPRKGAVTVTDWATAWMAQRHDLRPRTRDLYSGLLRLHILPALGDIELAKLTPSKVRSWNAALRSPTGPGASTAAKAYRLLRAMMRTAVADEIMVRNPCQVEGAGIERPAERPVATVADVAALAEQIAPRYRAVVLLGAWCGLRRGEMLGLRRSDIDLANGAVVIERSLHQLAGGELIIGPPKTTAGRRRVAVPPHLLDDLAAHLLAYVDPEPDAPVFTGEKGGLLRPHVLQKAWDQARNAAALPYLHLHDLRHAGNTWAAATGASTKELMARMGHANSDAALRYQHATTDRDRAIADALSKLAQRPS